ncbi:MAG: amidase, partial [Acetobacteraceae bacterium]
MTEPHWLSAAEAARAFAARRLSPVELIDALLARIDALQPKLHAFIRLDAEAARAAAAEATAEIARGRIRGPLHGVPVGVKDIIDVAGLPTTCHSRLLLENVAAADAAVVARLRGAGAIVLGKLATHEFAIGGPALDLPWPPARNPWDPSRFTGGSSSGSGAAVAAGMVLGATGSDTGGSIRLPAGFCGIAGLKPTPGLVSRRGVIPLAPSLDTAGPMAWTAEDCAILLETLAGHDPADPASVAVPRLAYASGLGGSVKGLRVGVLRRFFERDAPATPEALRMMAETERLLRGLGCRVEPVNPPPLSEYNAVTRVIICAEAYALHESRLRTRLDEYSRAFRVRVLGGALLSAADYLAAQRRRSELIAASLALFERCDVLLSTPTQGPAPLLAEQRPDDGFARPFLTS